MADQVMSVMPVFAPHIERLKIKDQDPNYHYRWASKKDGRIDFLKTIGYEVANDTKTGEKREVGNLILMRCPKEQFERREEQRKLINRMRMEGPRAKVKNTGEALGLEVTDKTREYRGPMQQGLAEGPSKEEQKEGVITRKQVQNAFNPHLNQED